MSEGNRGLQDLLTTLSPSSNRSFNLTSIAHAGGHESNSSTDNIQPSNRSVTSPLPKRTHSEHSDQSANLLNLLQFSSTSASQNHSPATSSTIRPGPQINTQNVHGRGVSSSDLVASYMGKPTISQSAGSATPAYMPDVHGNSANPQDYLLQLLNRSSHSQGRIPTQRAVSMAAESVPSVTANTGRKVSTTKEPVEENTEQKGSPIRVFGSQASRETTPFEPTMLPKVTPSAEPESVSIFNYVNPFDQLAASSPLKGRSGTSTPAGELHDKLSTTPLRPRSSIYALSVPTTPKDVLNTSGHEILQSIEGSKNSPSRAASSLIDLGAPTTDTITVAQALNEVGEQVNRQMEHALAEQHAADENTESKVVESIESQLQEAAAEIKEELNGERTDASTTLVPEKVAVHTKDIVDVAAAGNVSGHYESADDEGSSGKAEEEIDVPVYSFPMRPFVSIDLQAVESPSLSFRDVSITDIARLKKEFDQVDRTLATASNNYIVYALPKPGGIRIIRQDDGMDRQAFKETKDHVFNVAISNEVHNRKHKTGLETCIATAISGNVYWITLRKDGEDILADTDFESNSLTFPPMPENDDNTSGGQLKTRAKKSNRHPDCFAIGRGKAIHVVYPLSILSSRYVAKTGLVDVAQYFKEFLLKIDIGKAGKDFTFSEDDSVIATLDKAGRLRLWDVARLVDDTHSTSTGYNIRLDKPTLSFFTTLGTAKSWPTSVLFVDKPRAYIKGYAQRYIIVGLKQNHTLQLWDLGLGKAVQEINFPHEKESDAICSINYHHHSGIIVVAHPTRNSVYFIHLSAPKYNLPALSQSNYIQSLVRQDSSLPKPESTAIMSDIREYSFASKGQLRSIEILSVTADGSVDPERGLFELYVMHSKGVTCLNIRKSDLGWNLDNKTINLKNAEDEGFIVVQALREPNVSQNSEHSSVNGENVSSAPQRPQPKTKKSTEVTSKSEPQRNTMMLPSANTPAERKPRKRRAATQLTDDTGVPPPAPVPPTGFEQPELDAAPLPDVPDVSEPLETADPSVRQSPAIPSETTANPPENAHSFSDKFLTALKSEIQSLGERLKIDYSSLDGNARERQAEVLRLVSEQLGTNVEKTLSRIVMTNITQSVIPAINDATASILRNDFPDWLSKHLLQTLPSQLKLCLPEAITKAMSSPEILKLMTDQVTDKISNHVEKQVSNSLQNTILPSFQSMMLKLTQKQILESEQRIHEQIQVVNSQHEETMVKINQITALVQAFSETVHAMATTQAQFQSEILKSQSHSRKESSALSAVSSETRSIKPAPIPEPPAEQQEIELIDEAMQRGNYEQGVIIWLQSKYQTEIFDEYYVRYDPQFLHGCSSLVALSVIAALTISLVNNIPQRLHWLEVILEFIDPAVSPAYGVLFVHMLMVDLGCRYS